MAATSKFAVAAHVMAALALEAGAESVTSAYLASSVNTNPVVIRRLLGQLAKAGLVSTCPGQGGGVRLAKPAGKISLWDIYLALGPEPVFAPNPHAPNPKCAVSQHMRQALDPVFQGAEASLKKDLSRRSLASLADAVLTVAT